MQHWKLRISYFQYRFGITGMDCKVGNWEFCIFNILLKFGDFKCKVGRWILRIFNILLCNSVTSIARLELDNFVFSISFFLGSCVRGREGKLRAPVLETTFLRKGCMHKVSLFFLSPLIAFLFRRWFFEWDVVLVVICMGLYRLRAWFAGCNDFLELTLKTHAKFTFLLPFIFLFLSFFILLFFSFHLSLSVFLYLFNGLIGSNLILWR